MAILEGKHASYGELLFRSEWKEKRQQILKRDQYTCQFCGCQDKSILQVHHRQYHFIDRLDRFKMPWEYPDSCLITICKRCHDRGHNQYQIPIVVY